MIFDIKKYEIYIFIMNNTITNNNNNIKNNTNDIKNNTNDKQECINKCYRLYSIIYPDSLRNYYEDMDRINCLKICDIHDIHDIKK